MRLFRPLAAGAAALVVAAGLSVPASAQSAPGGLGTSLTSAKLLAAQLGTNGALLDLSLLTDEARATIDSALADPSAFARLAVGRISSSLVPGDTLNKTLPSFEATSSGQTSTDVAASPLGLPTSILGGSLATGGLRAILQNGVAANGIDAGLASLQQVLGGLLSLDLAKTSMVSEAAPTAANANRTTNLGDISVLDLGSLLQGIGLDLGSLSLGQLGAILDGLAAVLPVPLPAGATSFTGAVDAVGDLIDAAQAVITDALDGVIEPVVGTVNTAITTLLGSVPLLPTSQVSGGAVTQAVADATAIVNGLLDQLQGLVEGGMQALDDLSLLRLEGVELGVVTKAVEDVKSSSASIIGRIGKIVVGNTTIASNLDLGSATSALTGALAQANGLLSTVLGAIDPGLANLVKVSVLDKVTDVSQKDGYATATAGVTALTASITPPAGLAAILGTVNGLTAGLTDEVADVLGVAVAQVPAALGLDGAMSALSSVLGLTSAGQVLAGGATLRIAQVQSASNFRVASTTTGAPGSTPAGSPTLPRTGSGTMLLIAAAAVTIALIGRRLVLTPEPKPVRVRTR